MLTESQTVLTSEEIRQLKLTVDEAQDHPAYSHSRKGTSVWSGTTFYYFHCSDTPTGVHVVNIKQD